MNSCAPHPYRRLRLLGAALLVAMLPGVDPGPLPPRNVQAETSRHPTLVIFKAKRRLLYFENDILKRRFPITLGTRPLGDKDRAGDRRTPEGEYYVTSKKPSSRFRRFLGISYPNIEDARRGLDRRLISEDDFARIRRAIATGQSPPWGTPLGGYVGIHGEGGAYRGFTKRHHLNWTDGCIALSDEDIETLYHLVDVGTPVLIFP